MAEYLAPGVYVEETSYRAKSIEGVSTTTTGFIGPCRFGSVDIAPDILTSLGDFERAYGDRNQMLFSGGSETHNFLWHAARAFFEEGGRRLYVSRIFRPDSDDTEATYERPTSITVESDLANSPNADNNYVDGHARGWLTEGVSGRPTGSPFSGVTIQVRSRFPGDYGNFRVRFELRAGRNILSRDGDDNPVISGSLQENDIVWLGDSTSPISSPPGAGQFCRAVKDSATGEWRFLSTAAASPAFELDDLFSGSDAGLAVHIVTVTVVVQDARGDELGAWADLPPDPAHVRGGAKDSLFDFFAVEPASAARARQLPIVLVRSAQVSNGLDTLNAIFGSALDDLQNVASPSGDQTPGELLQAGIHVELLLEGGNDGARPGATEYEGQDDPTEMFKTGLKQFEDQEDISIVAAPGSTADFATNETDARAIMGLLISHATRMRYRIAVLDSGDALTISEVRDLRAKFDSKYAALYYPWVRVLDPVTRAEINLPPSGFVAGIYARNDVNRAVYKAPANEVVNLAIGFETLLNRSQQEVLNPEGINCFRYFEGRGMLLWGARTISSDPEWKYVNLRRYFAYIERSIDKGTQWAVFEPNGERLWANVRRTIEDFLLNEWQNGALLGDKPEKAYFVKCDRGTMSQNDLDNGRLVCQIGVAALRPAEFVIFRIGQWTSDRKA
jgi:uncharacterized protein